MRRIAFASALLALAVPLSAAAHEPGLPTGSGYVATVSEIRPNVLGLRAQVVLGDQLHVGNLSAKPVEILDQSGDPFIRIPSGKSRVWHDDRIVGRGDPPPPTSGATASDPRFVKNWTIPGRTAGRRFAIEGFLGWIPPETSKDDGVPVVALAGGALALVALFAGAAYLLGRASS